MPVCYPVYKGALVNVEAVMLPFVVTDYEAYTRDNTPFSTKYALSTRVEGPVSFFQT
jgi:hypothetical protein